MKCPFCGHDDTPVIDSRVNEDGEAIRRRRRCSGCDKRFTTYETVDIRLPQVVKQNGKREDFSLDKLRQGFARALHKRPVATELIEESLRRIHQKVLARGEREIESLRVGEMVMETLKEVDAVAYVRFASVYRNFREAKDFEAFLGALGDPT